METLHTDYLVVGAGASGMAFTDSLISECDADVIIVDRRHRPGGHWNDAYPFVRLHQPSAFYGVNSRPLGSDAIDTHGPNAGFYERASGDEICDYFGRVLDDQLLTSGRVRFFGMCEYACPAAGEHRLVSRLTGRVYEVKVRRRLVDARYLQSSVPANHVRGFDADPAVTVIPVGGLVDVTTPFERYVLVGGGKTAIDACLWLLDNGVDADEIRWIRPREAWLLDRAYIQPLELVASVADGMSWDLDAFARAESPEDLFNRLEECGRLARIDEAIAPTMYRCATVSRPELTRLRQVNDVVRLGRVRRIEKYGIVLERGTLSTRGRSLYIDCTASGLNTNPARPIFQPGRITIQQVRGCQPAFNAALIGYIEATHRNDEQRNRVCRPNPLPDRANDWLRMFAITYTTESAWQHDGDLVDWLDRSRLNVLKGLRTHSHEPRIQQASQRDEQNQAAASAKAARLFAADTNLVAVTDADPPWL